MWPNITFLVSKKRRYVVVGAPKTNNFKRLDRKGLTSCIRIVTKTEPRRGVDQLSYDLFLLLYRLRLLLLDLFKRCHDLTLGNIKLHLLAVSFCKKYNSKDCNAWNWLLVYKIKRFKIKKMGTKNEENKTFEIYKQHEELFIPDLIH